MTAGPRAGSAARVLPAVLRPHMPELDALRGVAVLAVVCYHGFFWSYHVELASGLALVLLRLTQPGWLGVQLFFVLSGSLISGILLDQRHAGRYFAPFYARRALRILPAYLAVLTVALAAGVVRPAFALLATFFLANVAPLLGSALEYGVLWSLAVEEQFYLVWPLAVRRLSRRALAWLASGVVMLGPVVRLLAWRAGEREGLYLYPWFTLDGLAMGALLALLLRRPAVTRAGLARVGAGAVLGAATLVAVGAPFGIMTRTQPLGGALQYPVACLAFSGILVLALLAGSARQPSVAGLVVLRFYGDISYGLYLVHPLLFMAVDAAAARVAPGLLPGTPHLGPMLLRFATAFTLATLVATLSRRTLERAFLGLRHRWPYEVAPAAGV